MRRGWIRKIGAAVVLLLFGALAVIYSLGTSGPPHPPIHEPAGAHTDAHGDPLPPGAIARLGTIRYRMGTASRGAAYLPDGRSVVTPLFMSRLAVVDLDSGLTTAVHRGHEDWVRDDRRSFNLEMLFDKDAKRRLLYPQDSLSLLHLQPDGHSVLTVGRSIRITDLDTGEARQLGGILPGEWGNRVLSGDASHVLNRSTRGIELVGVDPGGRSPVTWPGFGVQDPFPAPCADGTWVGAFHAGPDDAPTARLVAFDPRDPDVRDEIGVLAARVVTLACRADVLWSTLRGGELSRWSLTERRETLRVPPEESGAARPFVAAARITFAPDGATIAVPRRDRDGLVLELRDSTTGALRRRIDRFDSLFGELTFAPDGRTFVFTTSGGVLREVDVASGRALQEPNGHVTGVRSLAVSDDGSWAASCSTWGRRSEVRVWRLADSACVARAEVAGAVEAVAFVPDGHRIRFVTGERRFDWDPLGADGAPPVATDFAAPAGGPDVHGALVDATGALYGVTGSPDQRPPSGVPNPSDAVLEVRRFDDDAVLLRQTGLRRWTRPSAPLLARMARATDQESSKAFTPPTSISPRAYALLPDGRVAALAEAGDDSVVSLLDGETGTELDRFDVAELPDVPYRLGETLAASRDGRLVAVSGPDAAIRVLRIADGALLATFRGHRGAADVLAFTPDGRRLLSGSVDTTILVWDLSEADDD